MSGRGTARDRGEAIEGFSTDYGDISKVKEMQRCSSWARAGLIQMRTLCNGKTLAFQANDAGSIPAVRSNNSKITRNSRGRAVRPARLTHNQEVAGSNPAPATNLHILQYQYQELI